MAGMGTIETARVRRSNQRYVTRATGVTSRHCFSFGGHYDPANTGYGWLAAHNEETLAPGAGFASHRHRGVEIVTWVLDGVLAHRDSTGGSGLVLPGTVQRLSANSGMVHSEHNAERVVGAPGAGRCRFIQMWVIPLELGGEPVYELAAIDRDALETGLTVIASGRPDHCGSGGVSLGQPGAALHAARLSAGEAVDLPDCDRLHLFVASGTVGLDGVGPLDEGDSLLADHVRGGNVRATRTSEILAWEMRGSAA